jgi:metacaspase-1
MAKKAVIVGINDYAPKGNGGPDLHGCPNDAKDMANTLIICGFNPSDIRIVTNANATQKNIFMWLSWLFKDADQGDSLVFYYSGHGTRVSSYNFKQELDGLDEAICPHDYLTNGVIKDNEFRELFSSKVKNGVNLEVIFDCCHSGSGTRNIYKHVNVLGEKLTVRMIPPDLETEFYALHANEEAKSQKKARALVESNALNHTLWAGCRENELSYESAINGVTRGHFTHAFCKALRASNGKIIRKVLDIKVKDGLAIHGNKQTNQTEAHSDRFSKIIFQL